MTPSYGGASGLTSGAMTPNLRFEGLDSVIGSRQSSFSAVRNLMSKHRNRDDELGERDQAAAFAYAWTKVQALPGIDAFVVHRHVDHAHEGGLRLGLWTRHEGTVAEPGRRRRMWEVMRACDGPEAERALEFALGVIGVERWEDVLPDRGR
jgi:hypothetical protein